MIHRTIRVCVCSLACMSRLSDYCKTLYCYVLANVTFDKVTLHEEPKRKSLIFQVVQSNNIWQTILTSYTHTHKSLNYIQINQHQQSQTEFIASNLKMETITNSWQAWFHQQQLIDSHVKLWGNLNNSVDFFIFSQPLGKQWYFATEYQPIFQLCHCHFCSSYGLQIKTNLVLDSAGAQAGTEQTFKLGKFILGWLLLSTRQ